MSDHTSTWLEFMRQLDRQIVEREAAKLAAMTEEEREKYVVDRAIHSMINMA